MNKVTGRKQSREFGGTTTVHKVWCHGCGRCGIFEGRAHRRATLWQSDHERECGGDQ